MFLVLLSFLLHFWKVEFILLFESSIYGVSKSSSSAAFRFNKLVIASGRVCRTVSAGRTIVSSFRIICSLISRNCSLLWSMLVKYLNKNLNCSYGNFKKSSYSGKIDLKCHGVGVIMKKLLLSIPRLAVSNKSGHSVTAIRNFVELQEVVRHFSALQILPITVCWVVHFSKNLQKKWNKYRAVLKICSRLAVNSENK